MVYNNNNNNNDDGCSNYFIFRLLCAAILYLDVVSMYFIRANIKLAYKDLSLEDKHREDKMKRLDPKKKEQAERLGMAFGCVR